MPVTRLALNWPSPSSSSCYFGPTAGPQWTGFSWIQLNQQQDMSVGSFKLGHQGHHVSWVITVEHQQDHNGRSWTNSRTCQLGHFSWVITVKHQQDDSGSSWTNSRTCQLVYFSWDIRATLPHTAEPHMEARAKLCAGVLLCRAYDALWVMPLR